MAKSQASIMVRGLDLGASFLSALTKAVREQGISDEALYEALKPEGPLVQRIARIIAGVNSEAQLTCAFEQLAETVARYESGEVKGPAKRRVGEDVIFELHGAVKMFCEKRSRAAFMVTTVGEDFRLTAEFPEPAGDGKIETVTIGAEATP